MTGVVDYVTQVPDGWRVKEYTEDLTGETYVKVTAPSKELVEMGAAVSDGWLKVVSVVVGGKAAVSKMYLSTDPFKTYNVTPLKAVVEPYDGIQKYAYGMMFAEDFDKDQVFDANSSLPLLRLLQDIMLRHLLSTSMLTRYSLVKCLQIVLMFSGLFLHFTTRAMRTPDSMQRRR